MKNLRRPIYALTAFFLTTWHCLGTSFVIDWTYEYGVASPGTKSESVYGRLLYKGDEVPKEYQHVITPIGEFVYIDVRAEGSDNKIAWTPLGKLAEFADGASHAARTEAEVQELLTGPLSIFRRVILTHAPATTGTAASIAGPFDKPPAAVGKDWFYAIRSGLWVNPSEIGDAK